MTQSAHSTSDVVDLKDWLAGNWDPDLTVREWWERLGPAGWAAPGLPEGRYGHGLSRAEVLDAQKAIAEAGALGPPGGLGMLLAAPTVAVHGTPGQVERFVRPIVTGAHAWCQLFSEPGAGSDLAGLQTRAERDGDEWVITGQKVWTSGGQIADMGMLLARTNPDVPKHQGITYFAFDMRQPGVEVRPLQEMTGRAIFNEVFISEARVPHDAVIGELDGGWAVANTTLAFERAGLGAGGGSGTASPALPGSVAGDLSKRVGDFARARRGGGYAGPGGTSTFALLHSVARDLGLVEDPLVRQDLARLHTLTEIGRFLTLRHRAVRAQGGDIPGVGNVAKLSMSNILRLGRDAGLRMLGPRGTLHAYEGGGGPAVPADLPGGRLAGGVTEMALFAQGPMIYGGTDQIQRNIIGERVLGLPKEPNQDKTTPFKDLPRN
ncbi:MAG: acyl-CoA dehydrogenase family protein [Acidimicrobiales bacterium]